MESFSKPEMQHTLSPIDGSIFVSRPLADEHQLLASVEQATAAYNSSEASWKLTPLSQRKALCKQAIEQLLSHKDDIAKELSWMMGRPIRYGGGELAGVAERSDYMIEVCEQALADIQLEEKSGFTRYIKRESLGTVLVIAPWNYPFLTAINAIIPALLAGNCVILKHSAQTPLCAERLYQAFKEAGLPKGVFQYLHMSHDNTAKLIANEQINYVAFTGSVYGGKMVEKAACGRFIGVGLELGGKDPAYVREDADIDSAVETLVDGAFFNSGQSCCGIERIYVHQHAYDEFVSKAVALTKQYQLGRADDPSATLGPMVRTSAADFVREQIADAIEQGAIAHIDEALFPLSQNGTPYLAPQILTHVDHSMSVMTQESFGPVVGIMKVSSDDQAITLMNDSDFGLTASIFTQDIDLGIALGERLQTGTFFLNRCDYLDPALAWTGVKQSGRGCTLSQLGFEQLTRPKSFHIKHI
ncbi:aldehyde dehydrogenase [Shewanella sp. Choline-02u-19]|uniref:aldehyde dehydrogenase family protein n=1 Tax=unclassified Shewanella TaxID=196818 RepID=UPI000C34D27C|nr:MULTISPECIES: aldehyde dehydrogenase family protein [unclassified Shewanella]PKH58780.1 aldehyde dehydrogenase [Shewanella sp. Bg11-22]PKI29074.1 aldehyde dehydrogenase [Shewanella sp. Choline-02u-19]